MFCKYCGKELLDEAVICPNCGVWAKGNPMRALDEKSAQIKTREDCTAQATVEKSAKLSKLFGMLGFIMICVALMFVFAGISETVGYVYGCEGYGYEYSEGSLGFATFLNCVALGFSITSFVFGLKTKQNLGIRYVSTLVFILSVTMFFVPMMFFVV